MAGDEAPAPSVEEEPNATIRTSPSRPSREASRTSFAGRRSTEAGFCGAKTCCGAKTETGGASGCRFSSDSILSG